MRESLKIPARPAEDKCAGGKVVAEKPQIACKDRENYLSGAEARLIYERLLAWLKPCPCYKAVEFRAAMEFFRRR